jgi:Ca2+-binding EF-hand superfamily protein
MNQKRLLLVFLLAAAMPQAWAQAAKTPPAAAQRAASSPDAAADAFKAWDKDRNGSLSLPEFRAGWQQARRASELQARLRAQFATVDANKNDAIDPGEYGSLMLVKQAGKSAPQMSVFDGNRDGKLEFGEYVRLVQALAPKDAAKDAAK